MNVTSIKVTVGSVSKGYENKAEEGVHGYSGALNIRPAYQREYVQVQVLDSNPYL
jgi:hypothetical protein